MSKSSPEAVEAGTVLAGRYRVVRPLGKGGMGAVYLVQHLHTDQQLALKVLQATVVNDELALSRFRREARAPARINSDHVVQVTDADVAPELGGVPFLVMEWLRGQDLEELGADRTALPAADVVLYLRQVARALDKAHALEIIHRDLKPENIFLTTREDGTPCVKLLDFGIAKLKESADEAGLFKATGTGQIFGTPLYMSPEQTKAELDKISPQTDVWALGIIAHRLLTGTEPWDAPTLTALISQIAFQPLPVPSQRGYGLGPGFDAWFARCCAREPQDRFPSAGQAVAELALALGVAEEAPRISIPVGPRAVVRPPRDESSRTAFSATAPAPPAVSADTAAPVVPPSPRASLRGVALVAAAALALGVGGIIVYSSRQPSSPAAVVPQESTATSTALTATPTTIVTPSTAAPVEVAPPSASAAVEPTRSPPPVHTAPEASALPHHAPPPPPPKTATPLPPPPPPVTAPPAPTPPPPPSDPLGTRH